MNGARAKECGSGEPRSGLSTSVAWKQLYCALRHSHTALERIIPPPPSAPVTATCRFAPSATGQAHPGTLLAGLLCWLDARSRGARLVLRLEDLDPERCTPELVAGLQEDCAWFGLDWDLVEVQSAHATRHEAALDQLAELGVLYPCSLSRKELQEIGKRAPDGSWASDHRNRGKPLPPGGWRACAEPLRVQLPGDLPDPVVRRRDGAVAYQLAVVVDDAAAGVTRVVRGRDIEASTGTQVALQLLLGLPTPEYHHHALLLQADGGGKFSKFHGAVAVPELRQHYSPADLCGFLAHACGLRPTPASCTPRDLLADFSWECVTTSDVPVAWDGKRLAVVPTASVGTFAWLTPPAPAALAIVRVTSDAFPKLLDRTLPAPDAARFARLITPDGTVVDELVVDRLSATELHLMSHGGPGVRQAVEACLTAHRLRPAPVALDDRWAALAAAPSPAAVAWLLAHPAETPPFPADFLRRTPVVLITGPTNAGKSTLLNAWCGRRRALVSDIPGTTRDLLAAETLIAGWRIRLLDSAGLRVTDDPLERAGQELVAAARQRADVVLSLRPPGDDRPDGPTDLVVLGKADLRPVDLGPAPELRWSAEDQAAGLAELGRAVLGRLGLPDLPTR